MSKFFRIALYHIAHITLFLASTALTIFLIFGLGNSDPELETWKIIFVFPYVCIYFSLFSLITDKNGILSSTWMLIFLAFSLIYVLIYRDMVFLVLLICKPYFNMVHLFKVRLYVLRYPLIYPVDQATVSSQDPE